MEEVSVTPIAQGKIVEIAVPDTFLAEKLQPANRGELDEARRKLAKEANPNRERTPTSHRDIKKEMRIEVIRHEERNLKNASPRPEPHAAGRVTLPKEDSLLKIVQGGAFTEQDKVA